MFNKKQLLLHHPSVISSYETFTQDRDFHCRSRTAIMIQPEDNILQGTPDLPLELCLLCTLPLTRTRVIKTSFSGEWAPHTWNEYKMSWIQNNWFLQLQSDHRMPVANVMSKVLGSSAWILHGSSHSSSTTGIHWLTTLIRKCWQIISICAAKK